MAMVVCTMLHTLPLLRSTSRPASSHAANGTTNKFCCLRLRLSRLSIRVNEELRGALKTKAVPRVFHSFSFVAVRATMGSAVEHSSPSEVETRPFGVLFVCLGNICRSPSAEAVFRDIVEKRRLDPQFKIDSAGTIDYHEGNPADSRMKAAAAKRGVKLTSISRPIRREDFEEFDLILAMDKSNKADILEAYETWNRRSPLPRSAKEKVKLMCSYCIRHDVREVPDPYYGGPAGFEKVLDLLEDACEGLLDSIHTSQAQEKASDVKSS